MPRFSDTARAEIMEAYHAFGRGQANLGKEQIEITTAKTLIYIAERLAEINKRLAEINAQIAPIAAPFAEALEDERVIPEQAAPQGRPAPKTKGT